MKSIEVKDCNNCPYAEAYSNGAYKVCNHHSIKYIKPYSTDRKCTTEGFPTFCPI